MFALVKCYKSQKLGFGQILTAAKSAKQSDQETIFQNLMAGLIIQTFLAELVKAALSAEQTFRCTAAKDCFGPKAVKC
ncbi:hypothetical protein RUA4292_01915 [Ruegeria atlantica]|uniref:Uncharacterized protein n=1 Tax=Ruegeria atlantica TaxID=81569 RepID=A0A0P1EEI5_9RHOB|nr:hypothetical protein RUA4292_01915 [Ruegeria atlantica]